MVFCLNLCLFIMKLSIFSLAMPKSCGILVPQPGIKPRPSTGKTGVPTNRLPGTSLSIFLSYWPLFCFYTWSINFFSLISGTFSYIPNIKLWYSCKYFLPDSLWFSGLFFIIIYGFFRHKFKGFLKYFFVWLCQILVVPCGIFQWWQTGSLIVVLELTSCHTRARLLCSMWNLSSMNGDQTRVLYIAKQT